MKNVTVIVVMRKMVLTPQYYIDNPEENIKVKLED